MQALKNQLTKELSGGRFEGKGFDRLISCLDPRRRGGVAMFEIGRGRATSVFIILATYVHPSSMLWCDIYIYF